MTLINRMRGWAEHLWFLSNNTNVVAVVFYAHSPVCALKLCLLKTLEGPQREMSYCLLQCSEDPSQPLHHCPPLSAEPPVSQRYLLCWNSGQQEESVKLPHERLVTGGLGESYFVFCSWHQTPWRTVSPLWCDKGIIIEAHYAICSKEIEELNNCHKMQVDRLNDILLSNRNFM